MNFPQTEQEIEDMRTELLAARRTIEGMREDAAHHKARIDGLHLELADWRSGKRAITPPEVLKLSATLAGAERRIADQQGVIRSLQQDIDAHIEKCPVSKDSF